MEVLASSKRQKCLHMTSEQENEVVTSTTFHPMIPFVREEEEMAQIMKLNLVKEAATEGKTSEDDGLVVATATSSPDDNDDKREKTLRQQALEKLQKASVELTQLVALTENVNTQEHLVLLTRTMGDKKTMKGDNSTKLQRMCLVQRYYMDAQGPLQREYERMSTLIKRRQAFANSLICLGRVWRLKVHHSKGGSLIGKKSKSVSSSIGIDCSFGGREKDALWVPLVMGESSSPGYAVLSPAETNRPIFTISLALNYAPSNTTLAQFTSWETANERALSWSSTPGASPDTSTTGGGGGDVTADSFHEAIHNHCHKRQHESLSRDIMEALKQEASTSFDRWIISPRVATTTSTSSSTSSSPSEDGVNVLKAARFSDTLDVSFLNRGEVEIALSENITLLITLTPLPADSEQQQQQQLAISSGESRGNRNEKEVELLTFLKDAYMQCASRYVSHLSLLKQQRKQLQQEEMGVDVGVSDDMKQREGKHEDEKNNKEEAYPKALLRGLCNELKEKLRSLSLA